MTRKDVGTFYINHKQACNTIARLCYGRGVLPSVCPSVTLLYCVKTTQLRIMKSSLCGSLDRVSSF